MNTSRTRLGVVAIAVGFCVGLTGCNCLKPRKSAFFTQPEDQVVRKGARALFSAVPNDTNIQNKYQWLKNNQPIAGADAPTLVIADVGVADVASYKLRVQGPTSTIVSEPADLSMTTALASTNSWTGPNGPPGSSRGGCPGVYSCVAKAKDASGSVWFSPPVTATSCTLWISAGPSGNVTIQDRQTLQACCAYNTVTCPVVTNHQYGFSGVATGTCGATVTLNWSWSP